jgi:hypothetical protein
MNCANLCVARAFALSSRRRGARLAKSKRRRHPVQRDEPVTPRAIVCAAVLLLFSVGAQAQQPISCSNFRHNEDGSWTPVKEMTIGSPGHEARFGPEMSLRAGVVVNGVDLAGLLDVMCGVRN